MGRFARSVVPLLLAAAGWLSGPAWAAPLAPWAPVRAPEGLSFLSERLDLPPDAFVRSTFAKGMLRLESRSGRIGAFFERSEGGLFGDLGPRKWFRDGGSGFREVDAEERRRLRLGWLAQVPRASLVRMGGSELPTMVLATAADCGHCARLEEALSAESIGYLAAIGTIGKSPKWAAAVESAACSSDPAGAWRLMLVGNGTPAPARCDWPRELNSDVQHLLGDLAGSTPTAMFPDGSVVRGFDPILRKAREGKAAGRGI